MIPSVCKLSRCAVLRSAINPHCMLRPGQSIIRAAQSCPPAPSSVFSGLFRYMHDNITYSGGQEMKGQGGFYGSGGARAIPDKIPGQEERSRVLAAAADVQKISKIMEEVEILENVLRTEQSSTAAVDKKSVSAKSIELKAQIKKLMTAPDVLESLKNLEINGAPVWGLSAEEREMIILAKQKLNQC